MHQFLISTAAFIVLVGVIVVLHELGHFVMAKLFGVRVEAFSFGFGPRLFGFKYGGTDYKVCLLPLGGFVKMAGEAAEQNLEVGGAKPAAEIDPVSDPGSLLAKPRWQRMLIGLAGPTVNLLLTLFLMFVYYAFINEVQSVTVNTTTVEWVVPGSAAAEAGILPGDQIVQFDTMNAPDWYDVLTHSQVNANQTVPVTVLRNGNTTNLTLQVPASAKNEDFEWSDEGLLPQFYPGPIAVAQVVSGYAAEKAGLRDGDQIESVDGHAFHSTNTLLAYMQWQQGKPMTLTLLRSGATVTITAAPTKVDARWMLGFSPQAVPIRHQPLSFLAAGKKSYIFFKSNSLLVAEVLDRLFTHRLSMSQLMGPVGIAKAAGDAAQMDDWMPKFGLASEISLQLGILNLLPFPILDGGMILLLLIESALRHDISLIIKERIYTAAFVVLMAFTAFVLFNDVSRLGVFGHFRP
jgi:regulator of sigma E protease